MNPVAICIRSDPELDAPLGESNINRFIRVLQRFIYHSQFIVITHNQRTIGMADVLYGVTVEEHGSSKIVSVKFHKATEPMTETGTTPLETPMASPVDAVEDAPHQRNETLEIAVVASAAASAVGTHPTASV